MQIGIKVSPFPVFFLRQLSLKNHLYTGQTATYKHIHRHSRFFHTDSCKICCSYLIYMTKACTPNHGTANNRVMVHTPINSYPVHASLMIHVNDSCSENCNFPCAIFSIVTERLKKVLTLPIYNSNTYTDSLYK